MSISFADILEFAHLDRELVLEVLVLAAVGLGLVIAIQVVIGLARLFLPLIPAAVAALVGSSVAQAIREHRAPHAALAAVAGRLPWPFSWRVRTAARELAANGSCDIAATLVRNLILPPGLRASGAAAERLGAAALAEWCELLGARLDASRTLMATLAPFAAIALLVMLQITFFTLIIAPKFEQIFRELGMELDPRMALLLHVPPVSTQLSAIAGVFIAAWSLVTIWRWRVMRRQLAARVVLSGVAAGASEAELAAALALPAHTAEGGFPALLAPLGWPGISRPQALAEAFAHAEERDRRHVSRLRTGLQVVLPLLLAIPVWLLASGIFGSLIRILTTLAAQEG